VGTRAILDVVVKRKFPVRQEMDEQNPEFYVGLHSIIQTLNF
jgi:hypothetical protein